MEQVSLLTKSLPCANVFANAAGRNKNLKLKFFVLNLFALLMTVQQSFGQTPNGFLDFGNATNNTAASIANTGFGGVRTGSGGGGFTLQNPGQSIGTLAELRGIAPTGGSINSVGITSSEYGAASNVFTVSFELMLSGGSSGTWYFFAGNGTSFGSAQSSTFTGADVFTGIKWTFGASNAITTDNRAGSAFAVIAGTPFTQNTAYYVTIVGNNSAAPVNYGASQSVAAGTYDLWVNGSLVGNDLAKALLASASNINAFRFYGENSTGNVAQLAVDNIRWYNTAVLPATHLVFSGVPSNGTANNNLSSFNVEARSGSATGPVATGFTGTTILSKATGSGNISGTLGKAAVAGVTSYNDIKFDAPDTYTMSVSGSAPVLSGTSSSVVIASAAANSIATGSQSYGPFCNFTNNTITVPFSQSGSFAGQFNVQISNSAGTFPADATSSLLTFVSNTSTSVTAFIPSGFAAGTGYRVRVVNNNPAYFTSGNNGSNIIINDAETPAVTIAITSGSNPTCGSAPVTFTATATNPGGGTIGYQWQKDGADIGGATGVTYTASSSSDGDGISCNITITGGCVTSATASSASTKMQVIAPVTPTVSITASPSGTICAGTPVTFSATPSNIDGGTVAANGYQWKKNGVNVSGQTSNSYTAALANGDKITCSITVTGGCVTSSTALSNEITMSVSTPAAPTISADGPTTFCSPGSVTLTSSDATGNVWSTSETTQSIVVSTSGTYSVYYVDGNGCTSPSASTTVTANSFSVPGDVFTESIGTVSGTTAISAHEAANGFDNDAFTMSGTGDIRNTSSSTGYTGASGAANVFLTTSNNNFQIADINTTGSSNLSLSFGVTKSTTPSNGSELVVEVSADGISYSALTISSLPTGSGTATPLWYYRTATGSIPAVADLRVRFRNTSSTVQFRIDDISLTGDASSTATISADGPTTFCTPGSVTLTAGTASSYLWNNNATTQSITVSASDKYSVVLTDANGCTATSNAITVETIPGSAVFEVTGGGSYCSGDAGVDVSLSGSETTSNYQLLLDDNPVGSPVTGTGSVLSFGNQTAAGTYTVSASNGSCNTPMSGSAVVTVDAAPVITCPANVTVNNTTGACGANATYASATATGTPAAIITYSQASGSFFPVGTTTVTATATNSCGSSTCTFTVTITDNQAPIAACKNITVNLNGDGNAAISAADIDNNSSDNCGVASLSASPNTFNCSNIITAVTPTDLFISEYVEGSSTNKYIELYNGTASAIDLSSYSLKLYSNGSSTASAQAALTGTIAAGATVVYQNSAGVYSGPATTLASVINFNGDDAIALYNGADLVDIFGVIGVDPGSAWTSGSNTTLDRTLRRKPSVTSGVTVNPSGSGAAAFTTLETEWDVFGTDVVSGLGAHSTSASAGTPVVLTVTDVNGNTSTCTAGVTVKDVAAPVSPTLADVTGECSATATAPTATDICSGTVTGTTSDPLSYNTQGTHTIHWTFTDEYGNSSSATQNVIVDDVTAPAAPLLADATGECSVTVTAPTTEDNCAGTITGTTSDATNYTSQGSYVITWSFNDGNGNVSTTTQNVIVDDVTAPAVTTLADATGECSVTVTAPTAEDNCAGTITGTTTDATTYSSQGSYVVTWSFDDGNGNVSTSSQNVIVDDITAPVAPTLADATGECSVTVTAPTALDNCADTISGTTIDATTYSSQGSYVITWTFDDGNGNTSTTTQNVIVDDVTAPSAPVLSDATGECTVTVTPPTAGDNCSGAVTGTTSDATTYTSQGSYVITWSFDDGNGNTSTTTQNVIVDDVTAPAAPTLADATGECSVTVSPPTAEDNCAGSVTGTTSDPTTYTSQGSYVITWTFNDGNGNTSSATQNVIVMDITAPEISCPSNIGLNNEAGTCGAQTTYTVNYSDNCSGFIVNQNSGLASGSTFPVGMTTNTFVITDIGGNTASCSFTVTVTDVENPSITCGSNVSASNTPGQCNANVNLSDPAAGDNCAIASLSNDHPSNIYPVGTTTVTWTVLDVNGNTNSCSQQVSVTDNEAPSITCSEDVSVSNDPGECGADVTLTAPATGDNCGVASVTNDHSSATYPVGDTYVTWTVTDVHGNTNTCVQKVTVTDDEAPVITCSGNVTASTDSSKGFATVMLRDPGVSDNCDVDTIINNHPSTRFYIGSTQVVWTVTDIHGNTATCTQTVNVNDTEGPMILCSGSVTAGNTAGRCDADVTLHIPYAHDNSGEVSLTVDYPGITVPPFTPSPVTENDPDARPTVVANFPVGVTILTWTAVDSAGNTSTCTQTITVTDTENPIITCSGNLSVNNNPGQCSANVNLAQPATSDNCGVQSVSNDHPSNTYPVGVSTITWTVTDIHGNTATCMQTVTVADSEVPTISCSANVNVNNDNAQCSASVTLSPPTTSDNCGVAGVVNNHLSNIYTVGTTTVVWTVTDAHGNTNSCSQLVTVTDAEKPKITCPAPVSATTNSGCTATGVNLGSPVTSDNCSVANVTNNGPLSYPLGMTTVTWTVTDASGNTATCTQTVTVTDVTPPAASCKPATVTLVNGTATVTAAQVNNGSSDACGIKSLAVAPSTFTCSNIGPNTVVLTVTDNSNNTSTCSAVVTVAGSIPSVNITGSTLDGFCQGAQYILTANANQPVTYLWSTSATTQAINVFSSGTYSVTVKNTNGCTATASNTVTYNASSQLSSYVILAQNSIDFNRNTVNSGGVGVSSSKPAKAQLKDASMVTAPGTFVKAPSFNINGGSMVTNQITGAANPPLPPFLSYPAIAGGVNVNTANGSTTTLTDTDYGDIEVGENATVIFTQPTVYAKKLKLKKNATVKFAGCASLILKDKFDIDENSTVNPDQYNVTIYGDGADIDKGSTVYANLYVTKDIKTKKASAAAPTRMYGLFIADKVNGDDYTFWNFGTFCNSCSPSSTLQHTTTARTAPAPASQETSGFKVAVYPNPFADELHLQVNTEDMQTPVRIRILDAAGSLMVDKIESVADSILIGKSFPKGIYLIQVTQGKNIQVERVVKVE
jgi:hypothetical protein